MVAKFDFDRLLPEILHSLGFPEQTFLQIIVSNGLVGGEMQWNIRIPAPGRIDLDFKESGTDDIFGMGASLREAVESACAAYRAAAAINVVFYSNRAGFAMTVQQ